MMIETACAFTGHRPKTYPWKYDESVQECVLLKETLTRQIQALTEEGVTDFLSGMALGADFWCAKIVLDLQKKNPALKLHCILPCMGQENKWPASEQERYRSLLKQANYIIYTGREYQKGCMLTRNRYLVDHSSILLAVYNGTSHSGTGATVRYARQKKRHIYILHPVTRELVRETPDQPANGFPAEESSVSYRLE